MKRARIFLLTILTLTSGYAAARNDTGIAQPCAEVANGATGVSHYTLIGVRKKTGAKRFQVWLNAEDRESRVFCEIRQGEVTQIIHQDGVWRKGRLREPRPQDIATR